MSSSPALFQPIQVGDLKLENRIVLAPLTRIRAYEDHTPGPLSAEYYAQRASEPGTLLIAEAVFVAPKAVGAWPNGPGIWTQAHINGWQKTTDAVHAKGSKIFLQIFASGRIAQPALLKAEDPSFEVVGPSAELKLSGDDHPAPRSLSIEEIREYVGFFATAAENAVKAGFDGVEIHGANGYLVDQFNQSNSNQRTDIYGGTVENRARLLLEIVERVTNAIGVKKTGLRLGPWSPFQEMRMPKDEDVHAQFSYIVSTLAEKYSDLAYLHLIEARTSGGEDREVGNGENNDFIRKIWAPRPLITAGGYTRENAIATTEKHSNELVAFGRAFLANPDLPLRLKNNLELNTPNRATFYLAGEHTGKGYTDYPFASI